MSNLAKEDLYQLVGETWEPLTERILAAAVKMFSTQNPWPPKKIASLYGVKHSILCQALRCEVGEEFYDHQLNLIRENSGLPIHGMQVPPSHRKNGVLVVEDYI